MSQEEFFKKAFRNDETKIKKVRKGLEEIVIKTIRLKIRSGHIYLHKRRQESGKELSIGLPPFLEV